MDSEGIAKLASFLMFNINEETANRMSQVSTLRNSLEAQRQELEEVKRQIKLIATFIGNQGQLFEAFIEHESKKDESPDPEKTKDE